MSWSKDATASSKSLVLIAFVLAIAALYLGRQVFIPLALALVLSFLLTPFVTFLQRIRFGRVPAALTVLVLALALVFAMTWGVAAQLVEIMVQLPDYKDNLDAKIQLLHTSKGGDLGKATETLKELNKELATLPSQIPSNNLSDSKTGRPSHPLTVQVTPPQSNLVQDLRGLLGPLAGPMETAAIVIIFTLFMLIKREDLRNRAIRLAGRSQLHIMTQALDDAGRRLSRYLVLQCLVNAGFGLLFGIGLYFIGVPHALLWGVFAGVLRFVPFIGTFIAAILPIALALAVFPGWHRAAIAFGIVAALELLVSNVIEPLLYGAHTGISSLAILVAAVFWATIWGPMGLILSTPLTVCLIVLGRHVPQLNFLEVVLGDEPVLLPEQCFYQRLLAMDQEEARTIAEAHLKGGSLESLYDTVILPALKLAEQDYQHEELDEGKRRFVLRSVKNLIEDLGDNYTEVLPAAGITELNVSGRNTQENFITACVAASSGSDELVATMLVQLLRQADMPSREIRAGAPERIMQSVLRVNAKIVCISSISPDSATEARTLCRRLRTVQPALPIIVGFWSLDPGMAQQRLGTGCSSSTVKTLAEAVEQIRKLANPSALGEPVAESPVQNLSM